MGKAQTRASNKYIAKVYDRVPLVIPKGRKADLQTAAERAGESVNSYVIKAVLSRMGVTDWDDLDDRTADQTHSSNKI